MMRWDEEGTLLPQEAVSFIPLCLCTCCSLFPQCHSHHLHLTNFTVLPQTAQRQPYTIYAHDQT